MCPRVPACVVSQHLTRVCAVLGREVGGFSFDLAQRNALLRRTGMKMPGATKTGTTIVGVVYEVRCRVETPRVPAVSDAVGLAIRAALCLVLTHAQRAAQRYDVCVLVGSNACSWTVSGRRLLTRTARRSTTSLRTSTAAALVRPRTPRTPLPWCRRSWNSSAW